MLLDLAGQRGTMICIGLTGGAQIRISMDRVALNELDAYSIRANPNSYDEVVTPLRKEKVDFKPLDNSYVSLDGV
jgi:hypothetical protein